MNEVAENDHYIMMPLIQSKDMRIDVWGSKLFS
jgi:hypothetical protein